MVASFSLAFWSRARYPFGFEAGAVVVGVEAEVVEHADEHPPVRPEGAVGFHHLVVCRDARRIAGGKACSRRQGGNGRILQIEGHTESANVA